VNEWHVRGRWKLTHDVQRCGSGDCDDRDICTVGQKQRHHFHAAGPAGVQQRCRATSLLEKVANTAAPTSAAQSRARKMLASGEGETTASVLSGINTHRGGVDVRTQRQQVPHQCRAAVGGSTMEQCSPLIVRSFNGRSMVDEQAERV
jgi:hypothetical protein